MYGISGGTGEENKKSNWCAVHFGISLLTLVFVLLMFIDAMMKPNAFKSGFENMPDYGIGQRGDVIAAVPAYEEESMRQKVDRWVSGVGASQLTGTRDPPVFFQDNAVEASRRAGHAVSSAREGFEGGKGEDELERALAGRH